MLDSHQFNQIKLVILFFQTNYAAKLQIHRILSHVQGPNIVFVKPQRPTSIVL